MKNKMKKTVALVVCGLFSVSLASCMKGGEDVREIDATKTQIYVNNFDGGFGSDWLTDAAQRFEKLNETVSFEEGKMGVQVVMNNLKTQIMGKTGTIFDNVDEIYFTEYAYYYTLKSEGLLADITDAVVNPLSEYGETESIVDKMTPEQKGYFGIPEGNETKYYALPHYQAFNGLVYNIDLFDTEGYYFAKTPTGTELDEQFISKQNPTKSAGPDGREGTSDDGLPATYDQFFQLCDFIYLNAQTPVAWMGASYFDYLQLLAMSLAVDYEGLEQAMLNYTFSGSATNLCTVSNNGTVTVDANPTTITPENGYELSRQAGKYYATSFIAKLVSNAKYQGEYAFNGGYTHINCQDDFLYGGHDGTTKPIAMMVEGCWWQNEAKQTFINMSKSKGESFSMKNRRFGYMPLPKANEAEVAKAATKDKPYTQIDNIYSLCFMKANVEEWKKPLLLDFIRFIHTDDELVAYTQSTETLKAFDYQLDETEMSQLTAFGRSLVEIKAKSDIVYPFAYNSLYANNQTFFAPFQSFMSTLNGKGNNKYIALAVHEYGTSAAEYFAGMKTYYTNNWPKA